ncbi:unnamed protein product [Pieris macdunnoughi]|uniref:Uncharacterized protein n=1 Tax=Pieris macdunnoughi TaxID=345717 RepID=A0A821UME2_9NEOP|nr:unnamed protein product [Pieris macdunnoughi]
MVEKLLIKINSPWAAVGELNKAAIVLLAAGEPMRLWYGPRQCTYEGKHGDGLQPKHQRVRLTNLQRPDQVLVPLLLNLE